jgi:4-hydroxythreonine-4-phosphate dehydrogenase
MGDPAGIGGEITASAWRTLRHDGPCFAVIDDPERLTGVPVAKIQSLAAASAVFATALPVLPIKLAVAPRSGHPDRANAKAVIASIERAATLCLNGDAAAMVTNPINKAALYDAGFAYPGHTEFLAALTGANGKQIMMLASPDLRVVPVTVHASLRHSLAMLTTEAIVSATRTTAVALHRDFGIARPRLAVAGLNPHAGEQGALGDEETTIIGPAIAALRVEGIDVSGPWSPDTMFTATARARYDAAICMYHDQALIPLKTLDMDRGVNVTLGLPIVRTSPDHGTAYDIAGKGIANPASLIAAIELAGQLAARRV